MDEELLPALITSTSTLQEVTKSDLHHVKRMLTMVSDAASLADSIDDICKVTLTTLKVLEFRRRALNLPLGMEGQSGVKGGKGFLIPYDE